MGCWGMGITESDEYCEVYERFMGEYDDGKPLASIKKDILDDYLSEFDENDGVLHDVYFAIGKAEWMCGGISDDIFEKISKIINTGENITFYRELEASEKDLKQRQKNLEKFLATLSVPRGKTKKRKIPVEKYVEDPKSRLPQFKCGDVFAYRVGEQFRLLCMVSRGGYPSYESYCYAWGKLYDVIPNVEDLVNEYVIPLGGFTVRTFPDIEKLMCIGNLPEMPKLDLTYPWVINNQWRPATNAIAKESHLSEDLPIDLCSKLSDCLKRVDELIAAKRASDY